MKLKRMLVAVGALSVALAACSSDGGDPPSTGPGSSSAAGAADEVSCGAWVEPSWLRRFSVRSGSALPPRLQRSHGPVQGRRADVAR